MILEVKGNPNYIATVVEIDNIIELENCDNIQATSIFGNNVIISKDVKIGDRGLFFPVETKISSEFLSHNSLYRDKTLNRDKERAGFFELNGRIRCMKLRGNKSEGFYIPISSLQGLLNDVGGFSVGDEFDHINGNKLCEKYLIAVKSQSQSQGQKKKDLADRFDKLIQGQFNLHIDTNQLGKNVHKINPDDVISVTAKLHGSSFVSSYILCNRKLSIRDKIARLFGVKVQETEYDYIYSSRKVIKNRYINKKDSKNKSLTERWSELGVSSKKRKVEDFHRETYKENMPEDLYRKIFTLDNDKCSIYSLEYFESFEELKSFKLYIQKKFNETELNGYYSEDLWGTVHKELEPFLTKGMTVYGEVVGFLKAGGHIQKNYDYGCKPNEHKNYIYRITTTEENGVVFEWSMLQIQQWCKQKGLLAVPLLYYGEAMELFDIPTKDHWHQSFLKSLQEYYLEKKCSICQNNVWEEGIVLRVESLDIEPYKLKSFNFKAEESKAMDKGEENIEDNQ